MLHNLTWILFFAPLGGEALATVPWVPQTGAECCAPARLVQSRASFLHFFPPLSSTLYTVASFWGNQRAYAHVGLKTQKISKYFVLWALDGCSVKIYAAEVYFALDLRATGHSHVCFFSSEEQKIVGSEYTLLPHIPALHMTSKTQCQTQNGSTHGHIFKTFECQVWTNCVANQLKNCCRSSFWLAWKMWVCNDQFFASWLSVYVAKT